MSDDFQNQLHAGQAPPEDTEPEDIVRDAPEVQRTRWLEIFFQLNRSRRFKDFVATNYAITDEVDQEAKTITTLVIESPISVGPKLAPVQFVLLGKVLTRLGVEDPPSALKEILQALGQEDTGIVLDTDIKRARADTKQFDA